MKLRTIVSFCLIFFSTTVMAGEKIICVNRIGEVYTQSFVLESVGTSMSYKTWDTNTVPTLVPEARYELLWGNDKVLLNESGLGHKYWFEITQKFEGSSVKLYSLQSDGSYEPSNFHECIYLPE